MIEKKSDFLRNLRVEKMNRLIIGNLNINSISNKFDQLKLFVQGKVDIIIVTETKLDSTFPASQFTIDDYSERIVLTETEMEVEFLTIFEKTYQANY